MFSVILIAILLNFIKAFTVEKNAVFYIYDKGGLNENFKNNSQLLFRSEHDSSSSLKCLSILLKLTESQTIFFYKLDKYICEGYRNSANFSSDINAAIYNKSKIFVKKTFTENDSTVKCLNNSLYWNGTDCIDRLKVLIRTNKGVNAVSLLSNGLIAFGLEKNKSNIEIWNSKYFSFVRTLVGHTRNLNKFITLSNGDLVSASADETIKVWNSTDWNMKCSLSSMSSPWSLAELKNGHLASGLLNGFIEIWDPNQCGFIGQYKNHTEMVIALLVLLNGDLISGSYDQTIQIWDTNTWTSKKTLYGHKNSVTALGLLSNGYLVSGDNDSLIKIWDLVSGVELHSFIGHSSSQIKDLILLSNGDLASSSLNGEIKIWDGNNFWLKRFFLAHTSRIDALLLFNNDLLSASTDRTIKIWYPYD